MVFGNKTHFDSFEQKRNRQSHLLTFTLVEKEECEKKK